MKILQTVVAIALAASASLTMAGEIKPYTPQTFDQLTRAGKPVIVEVSAPWCPTCKAQKPIVEDLMKQSDFQNMTVLNVDFDTDKDALKRFKVGMQSTFVAFKGSSEVGRSVGDTTPSGIKGLFEKAVH